MIKYFLISISIHYFYLRKKSESVFHEILMALIKRMLAEYYDV